MRRPLISFQNFSFTYSDQNEPTLEELNVTIYEGEKILVLGPSGSGKTTFARCLTGVLPSEENGDVSGNILFHH
ncbi:MAG: ATP-binding cassette domain-containing protein, partial [Trichococcus flocculiformis]